MTSISVLAEQCYWFIDGLHAEDSAVGMIISMI